MIKKTAAASKTIKGTAALKSKTDALKLR